MNNAFKVLVTGGAGFIGSHTVVELVENGFEVVIADSLERSDAKMIAGIEAILGKKVTFYQLDCLDPIALDNLFVRHKFTDVIHFAAYKSVNESVEKPIQYYKNNIGSLVTLLEVMHNHHVRNLVFSSSCTVYGQPDRIPVDETAPFKKAESPYGATKQMCERILQDAVAVGLRVISLRYFNPIGAHQSALIGELPVGVPNNLVPFVTQTAAGIREQLTVFGNDYDTPDGSCLRDFIDVVDVATAHVKALQYLHKKDDTPIFETFNLGTGIGISVLQLIAKFIEVTGVKLPYTIGNRRPGDVEKVFADPSKINQAFGWQAKRSLGESLANAWRWEKKIRNL